MAIITKPGSIAKGTPALITLNKAALKVLPAITDAYFQDDSNWKTVAIEYKNAEGQKKTVVFDATKASPVGQFKTSAKARGDFQVQSISIFDVDGGYFKIPRASLTTSELDIGFGASGNATAYRYVKLQIFEAFTSGTNTALASSVSLDELKLKYDGSAQSLVGLPVTGFSPSSGNFGTGVLNDGVLHTNNSGFWNVPASWQPQITVDLGSAKVVTDILMAPQGSDPDQVYNVPKKFEVFGSNDGVTFTSIKAIDQTSITVGAGAGEWKAGQYTSFSL
jgi:hypothetical protein